MTVGLSPDTRCLVRLSAAMATGARDRIRKELLAATESDLSGRQVEEVILQSYLFLGYPAALNAMSEWRRLVGDGTDPSAEESWDYWTERGAAVCAQVYGGQYDALRRNVRALHPDLERWMVVEGYGKVLGRPGLSLVVRELCILVLLAVLGTPRQLYSHLRGALNVGAPAGQVDAALEAVRDLVPDEYHSVVQETWIEVRSRTAIQDGSRPANEDGHRTTGEGPARAAGEGT